MKTVMLINSSGAHYFRRNDGAWQHIEQPERNDKLWVIANLPEETLEPIEMPLLFGPDRSHFLERRLAAAFMHSQYRAAPLISGGLLKPGTAVLTGLTTAEAVSSRLDKLELSVAGVWGMSMLLTLMTRRLGINSVMLALPSVHYLRILVIKDGIPVLTRCIHRYSEDSDRENDGDTNEILRTRQHLENRRIVEHDALPPVLYLGDTTLVGAHLTAAGVALLPLPGALSPGGDAEFLHPLFEYVITSPRGQLAPLQLRARHLTENIRRAAYAGCAMSLLIAMVFGQQDLRKLIDLHRQKSTLNIELQQASNERERLEGRISASGTDPALVRHATKFASLEMDAAPTPASILKFTAGAIADLPQVRIKNLTFRFPKPGERYCQGHSVIDVPLLDRKIELPGSIGSKPDNAGGDQTASATQRYTELQFSILLTDNLAPAAQVEIRKRISATLKSRSGVQLMLDPAALSLINTLKGGVGLDTSTADNLWCMSIPWSSMPAAVDSPADTATSQSSSLPDNQATADLPQAGQSANESLREFQIKELR